MRCPACGNENREEARFCDSCGASLAEAMAPPPAEEPRRDQSRTFGADGAAARLAGSIAGGRYGVERFLGRGGRKSVFLARDSAAGDGEVAVAVFETEGVGETALARGRREAQAMATLGDHAHIVRVHDAGEHDGTPYMVSEFMPGGDVRTLLGGSEGRRLEIARAIAIAADVTRALEHAHSRGIVHRDIKPANVWLADDGSARLGDFGLATDARQSREAVEGMLVGTVAYLPPEQALGRSADARADLYSLGAMLYELLAGEPPFPGEDAVAVIGRHLNAEPIAPSRHRPEVPAALDELVLGLLAKAPKDRPESAASVRAELEAIAAAPPAPAVEEQEVDAAVDRLAGLAGGVFVGRDRELEEMRALLESAVDGRGRLLLLVGEPGIGKTRTAEELATYAQVRGAKVHWGRCQEAEGTPAFWPWREAIRSYIREADPVGLAWELGGGAADIAQMVPEVKERVSEVGEPPELEPEQARFRLFDSVAGFLAGASRSRPLVLVLDDLHWADEPSLLLLRFLARRIPDSGLLVIATYRDVELGRHHPLAETLAELAELDHSRRVALRGLDASAIQRFVELTAGAEPPAGLAEAVRERTEGNPFFVGEVVRLLTTEGSLERGQVPDVSALAIPQGVREAIGRRLDGLDESANSILTLAAAIGREFDLDVLVNVAGCEREEALAALNEAVFAARVVKELPQRPGRYAFAHALVRETLYSELTGARRVQVHGQIAEALERAHGDRAEEHVSELAHQFLEAAPAGEVERAIDYAQRAARQASDELAHEQAAAWYRRALEVLDLDRESPRPRRLELLLELGEAETRAGRLDDARPPLEEAASIARDLDEAEALARAALAISRLSVAGVVDDRLIALHKDALEAVGEEDGALRSMLLGALAQELYWVDPAGEAVALGDQALEMARRLGDDDALAQALIRRQFAGGIGPELTQKRLEEAQELHDLAKRTGDLELELRAHVYRLRDCLEIGDIAAVDRDLAAYERLAGELRQPQHLWHVPLLRGMRALIDGRFDDAERLAEEARLGGEHAQEPVAGQFFAIQASALYRHQGRMDDILPLVEANAERFPAIPAWKLALADIHAESGRIDEARAAFERLAANDFADLPRDAVWPIGIAISSEVAHFLGDRRRAAILYELMAPYDGLNLVAGRAAACYGPVARVLGLLAATLGRQADAIRHLEDSIEMCARMGERPFVARARYELARVLQDRGRPGDMTRALELAGEAVEAAQEMGMRTLVERALAMRLESQGITSLDTTSTIDVVSEAVASERPDISAYAAADGSVTILFSDIEDSTLMTERLGDARWIEVLRSHNEIFRRHLRRYGGYEVKNQGDGFMLVFPDPRDALHCAVATQRELADADVGGGERIRVRMGMHAGEAIAEEGDLFGRSVILAARIAARAQGGEILVSEPLRDLAAGDGEPETVGGDGLRFDDGRDLELKGMAGTHRVFRAEWEQPVAA